ncbi:hypothetical protein PAEVO_40240 [Paenibacillus sp. GM2FR]|uniref:helix-turn-helix domain-containing protein n=1 Tax=Paenibacillus sp. GM2FR TaxID=2059268 RepID=UPI000CACF772|nr:hypothetical protein PAEVO_40240 [Paenibacillus sp. GM2FR]
MNTEQQIEFLKRRLVDLQQYVNREIELIIDDIKRLERKEEDHKTQMSDFKLPGVCDDSWRDLPEVMRPTDIKQILGIGQQQAYELINSNQFHYVRVGRTILIPKKAFINWLEGNNKG